MGGKSETESTIVMTGRGVIGKPTSGNGLSVRLSAAQLLDEITLALAEAPTTEPVAPDVVWVDTTDNGVVKLSVGIPPAFTTHPTSQTKSEGETVTFTWAATNATSYQLQKQEGGSGSWANVSGATSSPWTSGALTHTDDNTDTYRVVATGPGGTTNSNTATLSVTPPVALDGIDNVTVAISPMYLMPDWSASHRATVNVEKGWGSGTFQDLYPHTDGKLYTAHSGGGTEASVWAAGAKLFVTTPYNQCLASEVASGHPTAVTDNTRRVILDVSTTTLPRFAGIEQGSQDASQHATERGYDLNVSVTPNAGLLLMSLDQVPASATTAYRPIQANGGSGEYMLCEPGSTRWYHSGALCVGSVYPQRLPALHMHWLDEDGTSSAYDAAHGMSGGVPHENVVGFTPSGTSTPLRIFGPTAPLTGSCYAVVVCSGGYVPASDVKHTGTMVPRLHSASQAAYGANEITVYSPTTGQTFTMNRATNTGTIKIVCASGAGRSIEASWNGGAWATIGTTDSTSGYLVGSLTGQAAGSGTLSLRVAGQGSAAATVATIRVGVTAHKMGQSNADGRGDDITLSVTRSLASNSWTATTATSKSWIWALLQSVATTESAPAALGGRSAGATLLCFDNGGSTDGRHGHWHPRNPGTSTTDEFAYAAGYSHLWTVEPEFCIWHQGEEDAAGGTTKAVYKQALIDMWTEWRVRTGWTGNLWVMVLGRVGSTTDANVNAIRYAQIEAVNENPTLLSMGGSLAHLEVGNSDGQNVHFETQAQKDAIVAVFIRHAIGSGRAHRYSSGSKATSTATLTFTGGSGDLVVGASPTLGWTCTDGSGSITVTGVSASGDDLTLTFNRSISGSLTIKWCSHYSGIGATIADSDATTPLPPEPFEVTL